MVESVRRSGELQDMNLASRKAQESVHRRHEAVQWLKCFVGPIGIHSKPSEREFISCLRNGIILCNVINKIQPGCIPKVVDSNEPVATESIWDSKPLPAYQYFENVRNFLKAVEELKLPAFEASDLQRENFEANAAARIADCILALKSYHEWKECSGGNGVYKHVTVKSPRPMQSASKNFGRSISSISAQPCRGLDMSSVKEKQSLTDSIVKIFKNHMVNSKENIHDDVLSSFQNETQGPDQLLTEILSRCLEEELRDRSQMLKSSSQDSSGKAGRSSAPSFVLKENSSLLKNQEDPFVLFTELLSRGLEEKLRDIYPMLKSSPQDSSGAASRSSNPLSVLKENSSLQNNRKFNGAQTRTGSRDHWHLLQSQEKELSVIKTLQNNTKREFEEMQSQMLNDMMHIGSLVEEMSAHALGYQKVVKENRKLYNLAQDLKAKSKDPPKSPSEKSMLEGSFPRSRRLSLEKPMVVGSEKNQKLKEPKSPSKEQIIYNNKTPPKTRRQSIETPNAMKPVTTGKSKDPPKSPTEKSMLEGSFPRSRRLSLEKPMVVRSEKNQKLKEPKSPKEQIIYNNKTPPKTRRQSIETPNTMKPVGDIRRNNNLHGRRLSSEGPNSCTKGLHSPKFVTNSKECPKSPPAAYRGGLTFTDCATRYPSFEPPKTPEQQNFANDLQTSDAGKSTTHKKGSQFKRSLRTIGKLINGSEKRSQPKGESSSIKGKGSGIEPKSPPATRTLRRQSLTGIPAPPGSDRRSSLGGSSSTEPRSNGGRNAKTPPPARSSAKNTGRWM